MPIAFQEVRCDDRWPEVFELLDTGALAERHWFVDTDNYGLAVSAAGLPALRSAYDSILYPDLKVVSLRPVWRVHKRTGESDGRSVVKVRWETPGLRGKIREEAGKKWSEVDSGTESITVKQTSDPTPRRIPDGVSKEVGFLDFRVRTFYGTSHVPDIARLNDVMDGTINSAPFSLPPLYGSSGAITIGVGQAHYRSADIQWRPGEVLEITHVIGVRKNWNVAWSKEDEKGEIIASGNGPIFTPVSYAGLW